MLELLQFLQRPTYRRYVGKVGKVERLVDEIFSVSFLFFFEN